MSLEETINKGNEKDGNIFFRYFIIAVLLGILAVSIFVSAFNIGVKERKAWLKVAEGMKRPDRKVNPMRGNIYSDDDRLMATSAPQYYMYLDFRAEGFALDSFLNSKYNSVDSLACYLSGKFKNRSPSNYKAYLLKGLKSKARQYRVYEKRVSYADLKEIKTFPFLRFNRNRSGFYTKEMMKRQKPFGTLASRTIGDIYNEIGENGLTKGKNGLELQYDSLLRGVAGLSSVQRVGGRWTNIVEVEPVNGMDIRSTIDINIQDLVEKALKDKLREIDADAGTAVVMEVKTGEIKAITNMARLSPGRYAETLNHAVADEIEPGSTFKIAAMMVAIEDGVVQPSTPVDVGNGIYMYRGRRMTDHNARNGGYGLITAEKAIWYSSNIGIAKIVLNGYSDKPKKFVDGLSRVGMDADLKIEIPGSGKPKLRWPSDKLWSKTSLPWMTFGYEVQMPPIQTLTFFNAIANNGKMVRPMFVKDIIEEGNVVHHFDTEVLIKKICSNRTLKIIQDMLYHVVNYEDPLPKRDGTGKPARSDAVTIAGKTGTAQIASRGGYSDGHIVSFCGYFPYENPAYSCIVSITRPRNGPVSGGLMAGTVVKEIAEKVHAEYTSFNVSEQPDSLVEGRFPEIKSGSFQSLKETAKEFDLKLNSNDKIESKYISVYEEKNKGLSLKERPVIKNLVPNVMGMGAKDAVYLLEESGLSVSLRGKGRVVSQSIKNGKKVVRGQTIVLRLKE